MNTFFVKQKYIQKFTAGAANFFFSFHHDLHLAIHRLPSICIGIVLRPAARTATRSRSGSGSAALLALAHVLVLALVLALVQGCAGPSSGSGCAGPRSGSRCAGPRSGSGALAHVLLLLLCAHARNARNGAIAEMERWRS